MAKTPKETLEAESSEFITVTKDGEEIDIHPDAEEDHRRLGWVRA